MIKIYLLAFTLFALIVIIGFMVVQTVNVRREMKQLTEDYLKPRNDSFINPKVNISDTVEDLEKEERFFNWMENEKKEKKR
jgi:GTP-binding protein EngB required for normal cell division